MFKLQERPVSNPALVSERAAPAAIQASSLQVRRLNGMARAVLPACPVLPEAVREQVAQDTVEYVVGQIALMPTHVRVPYSCLLIAFDWLAFFRYGRRFVSLAPARQQAYVTAWANGPISIPRDTIKLVRTLVLLQFLDHHLVLEALEAPEASTAKHGREGSK